MRATSAAAVCLGALLLVACGTNSAGKSGRRPAVQVADTVNALHQDLLTRNWTDVCEQLFSAAARAQAGGSACPDFVSRGAAGLRGAEIRIRSIKVNGTTASADVITTAEGQAPVPETIQLVYQNGRFRIDSLAR